MILVKRLGKPEAQGSGIINSPSGMPPPKDCDRLFARGVYVYSDPDKSVNKHGIDMFKVALSDAVIIRSDDAIALKPPSVITGPPIP